MRIETGNHAEKERVTLNKKGNICNYPTQKCIVIKYIIILHLSTDYVKSFSQNIYILNVTYMF